MTKKWTATITRDITRHISLGALQVTGLCSGEVRDIAPPTVHAMPLKAGTVAMFPTKSRRDAYIAAINSEHEGAAVIS